MRTANNNWVPFIGVAFLFTGCTSGEPADSAAPPRLTHLIVQDDAPEGGRGIAVDVLDAANSGKGVPIGIAMDAAGAQIRLIWSKTLDSSIEIVTSDPATGQLSYRLVDGIITLTRDGTVMDVDSYYQPNGTSSATENPVFEPYGPALVLIPRTPLHAGAVYRLNIDGNKVVDRRGRVAVDQGGLLLGQKSFDLKTEDLMVLQPAHCPSGNCTITGGGTTYPDASDPMAVPAVAASDALQVQFNADVDESMVAGVTLKTKAGNAVMVQVFHDRGRSSATKCTGTANPRLLNVVPVSAAATPASLPAGEYLLTVESVVDQDSHRASVTPFSMTFQVSAQKTPLVAASGLVYPEGCAR